jgi:hypothetical protein
MVICLSVLNVDIGQKLIEGSRYFKRLVYIPYLLPS